MPKKLIPIVLIGLLLIGVGAFFWSKKSSPPTTTAKAPTKAPAPPVNQIPVSDRPYVTLQPLTARNELEITIGELKVPAKTVEVVLEYDRNKGILDAVLKQFTLSSFPYKNNLFLGSKSAGGHITYHDDVIGGKVTMTFEGGNDRYALEVPWRYADTQTEYKELGTSDGRFQVMLEKAYKTPKVVVMQSPGLPKAIAGEILAGPYLFRGLGALPDTKASVKIRLLEETAAVVVSGYDGSQWKTLPSTINGKTVEFQSPVYEAYIVAKP